MIQKCDCPHILVLSFVCLFSAACSGRPGGGATALSPPAAEKSRRNETKRSVPIPLPPLRIETANEYREPPPRIAKILTATAPPEVLLHTSSQQVALLYQQDLVSLDTLARPFLGLAGFRMDPAPQTVRRDPMLDRIEIVPLGGNATPVVWQPQAGASLAYVSFSPDGKRLAGVEVAADAASLRIFDIEEQTVTTLPIAVNSVWGAPCFWQDSESLICRVVPADRGNPPARKPRPTILEHRGGLAPTMTYTNLLTDACDEALFEHYFTADLAHVHISGTYDLIDGTRGLLSEVLVSPNRQYAIIVRIKRPYSRIVPASRFPRDIEIWDLKKGVKLRALSLPNDGAQPARGFPEGPRQFEWRPGEPASLGYVERDTSIPGRPADRWMALDPPFIGAPRQMVRSDKTIDMFGWTTGGTPYYTTLGRDNRKVQIFIIRPGGKALMWEGEVEDRLSNPGHPLRTNGETGAVVERMGGVFFAGDGFSKEGPQPFLERFDLNTGEKTRLRTSSPDEIETTLAVLDDTGETLLTQRETETIPFSLRIVRNGKIETIWQCPHPYPELKQIQRRYLEYKRKDGVALFGTLYLPPGYRGEGRLPTVMWIYPTQYSDATYAEAPHEKSHRFFRVKGPSPMIFPLAGYALLLNPSMPIIGDRMNANDQYLSQLEASAEAAVEALVSRGVADPDRIAIAGRSYGAFSAANLLAHTRLFRTGIAMSGAYNRTLTPFGFQDERRSFWKATDVYARMSPFYYADRIEAPLLLIHGEDDENPGTSPIQSKRFFHALVGNGNPVRYVALPHEGHTYHAKESVLHIAQEMLDWLERIF